MSYDLHIVRTEDWTDASSAPITKSDVDALIAKDSELGWSTKDFVGEVDKTEKSTRYYAITWRSQPCFWWYGDHIQCPNPDELQISKLVEMSRALNARVVGDDGEVYPLDQQAPQSASKLKSMSTATPPPAKQMALWLRLLLAFLLGCVLLGLKILIFGP